jgi:hypothetical protein
LGDLADKPETAPVTAPAVAVTPHINVPIIGFFKN